MSQVTLSDAKEVAQKLVSELHPKAVIVFGSVATQGEGNDLDLLVIAEENGISKKEAYKQVGRILDPFFRRFGIDYFVATPSTVRELFLGGSPFLRLIQREGRSLYMKDSVKDWFAQAKEDLSSAEYLLKGGYYRGACFQSQQALEKAMKGILTKKGWELKKTHSIRLLMTYAEGLSINFDLPGEMVTLIDSLYRGRYPGEEGLLASGDPTKQQTESILSCVKSFFRKQNL